MFQLITNLKNCKQKKNSWRDQRTLKKKYSKCECRRAQTKINDKFLCGSRFAVIRLAFQKLTKPTTSGHTVRTF